MVSQIMPAPNRRVQVELWRAMSAPHDSAHPVSDHLSMIEDRIQDLEATGFTWTKDSVMGLLFQAGLPTTFPDSFDQTNDILQQSDQTPITASRVRQAIEADELRMKSSTLSLSNLPPEILAKIVQEIITNPGLSQRHRDQKSTREALYPLASVSRHLNRFCAQYLWEVCHLTKANQISKCIGSRSSHIDLHQSFDILSTNK